MSSYRGPSAALLLALSGSVGCDDGVSSSSASGATSGTSGTTTSASSGASSSSSSGAGGGAPEPGLVLLDYGLAIDVTPDGRRAVFEDISTLDAKVVFYDTVTNEASVVTSVGDPTRDFATGVSAGGRVTALYGDPVVAGLFGEAAGWSHVETPYPAGCDQDLAGAWDVSADGSVVVGMVWNGCFPEAFRWTDSGGTGTFQKLEVLGSPALGSTNPPTNRATVVSDDGKVAAGFAQNGAVDRTPAVWKADGTGTLLLPQEMDAPGEVLSIDADGRTAAGIQGNEGFVWNEAAGMMLMTRFDVALPTDPVYPNAMTADGTRVFGGVGDAFFGVPIAFVWSEAEGMHVLSDVAAAAGITMPAGLVLNSVLGASADGTVLIGVAMEMDGTPRTFVLRLPAAP
ncbi:MAG: hypothetical protein U0414_11380 [Polyangiaceae bacterium]